MKKIKRKIWIRDNKKLNSKGYDYFESIHRVVKEENLIFKGRDRAPCLVLFLGDEVILEYIPLYDACKIYYIPKCKINPFLIKHKFIKRYIDTYDKTKK